MLWGQLLLTLGVQVCQHVHHVYFIGGVRSAIVGTNSRSFLVGVSCLFVIFVYLGRVIVGPVEALWVFRP